MSLASSTTAVPVRVAASMSTSIPRFPRPIFKPREIKTAGASRWYVEAEWDDGTIEEVGDFESITQAWDWIARESRAWVATRRGE
jgi:hypothetical protein